MVPPFSKPLDVPYHPQADDGYCLPACVQMVLDYMDLSVTQKQLSHKLDLRPPLGAPASNVTNLRSDVLDVTCTSGTLNDLRSHVSHGHPPIVFVQASELPHWRGHISQHALVVVGIDERSIHILDPAADDSPIPIPIGDFMLAWIEMDYLYALLTRSQPR